MSNGTIYIDVDGVLNAFRVPPEFRAEYLSQVANGYLITYNPTITKALLDLATELDLEIVWATTWGELATVYIAPLVGFGADSRWMTVGRFSSFLGSIGWKSECVREDVEGHGNRFVWIDDEIREVDRNFAEASGGLAIRTDDRFGLVGADLEAIREHFTA